MRIALLLSVGVLSIAIVSSCTRLEPIAPLPEGIQTLKGTVESTELSLVRRGTHLLLDAGVILTYLESTTVNLRSYEGKNVTLRGTFERNTDPSDPPVLLVESIVDIEEQAKEWDFASLGVHLTAPHMWQSTMEDETIRFSDTTNGLVLMSIYEEKGDTLPEGTPMVVGGKQATGTIDERNGGQTVAVLRDGRILTFLFTPRNSPDSDVLREQWLDVLHSLSFNTRPSSAASSRRNVTGTGALIPCGGTAGILCPKGMYCEVTDFIGNMGQCRGL